MSKKIYKYIEVVNKGKELKNWADAFADGSENVVQWLGNMNQIVCGKVNGFGLSWNDEKQEIYLEGDNVLEQCEELFDAIFDAYENGGEIWEELGLGGDDDVDYNSTYPSSVIAVLKELQN